MELALSLGGDPSTNPFSTSFLDRNEKKNQTINTITTTTSSGSGCIIGSAAGRSGLNPITSCMGLGLVLSNGSTKDEKMDDLTTNEEERNDNVSGEDGKSHTDGDSNADKGTDEEEEDKRDSSSPSSDHNHNHHPVQLDLLPFSPVPRPQYHQTTTTISNKSSHHQLGFRFPWLQHHATSASENPGFEPGTSGRPSIRLDRLLPAPPVTLEEQSSPNSAASSFVEFSPTTVTTDQKKTLVEFSMYRPSGGIDGSNGSKNNKRPLSADRYLAINYGQHHPESSSDPITASERAGSRGSDDDENGGSTRKKLRLSKEQSAFLEESFKEHHTLNPKQKLALAKQLSLRPRQVEVWFQNRRARTKLKQTEVDCEYLKRCCETLTEENRRLQKELQELRALKTCQPFYMQLPPTTLTMCPSCERVATTTSAALPSSTTAAAAAANKTTSSVITRPIATVATVGGPTTALTLSKSTLPFATAQQHSQAQPRQPTASS